MHGELKWFNTTSNINEHYSLINRKKSMLPVLGNVAAKIIICQSTIYIYILGVARYAYRTVRFTGYIPNGSDHPYPLGVRTLE